MMMVNTPAPPVVQVPPRGEAPWPAMPLGRMPVGRMMVALVLKEVREMAVWAVLAMVALGVALAFTLRQDYSNNYGDTALSQTFHSMLVFVPCMAAAVMGFAQFFHDTRQGPFALLMHRPASPRLIFLCKVAVGVGMYLVAMLVPLWLALLWVSDPRHLSLPFEWNMAWSPMVDLVAALPFYFGAVLVAERSDARWWVSRLLPIGATIFNEVYNMFPRGMGAALLVSAFWTLVLGGSAGAHFFAAGQYAPQGRVAKSLLSLTMFAGLFILAAGVLNVASNYYRQYDYNWEQRNVGFLKDGTPIILHDKQVGNEMAIQEVEDLAGKVLFVQSEAERYNRDKSRLLSMQSLWTTENRGVSLNPHEASHYFLNLGRSSPTINWYLAASRDYLVGYRRIPRELVGAVGADGFEPHVRVPAHKFAEPIHVTGPYNAPEQLSDGTWSFATGMYYVYTAGDTLYRLDETPSVTRVYTDPAHESIISYTTIRARPQLNQELAVVPVVRTVSGVTVLSGVEQPQVVVRYAVNPGLTGSVAVGYLESKDAFLFEISKVDAPNHVTYSAATVRRDGTVESTIPLPLPQNSYHYEPPFLDFYVQRTMTPPVATAWEAARAALEYDVDPRYELAEGGRWKPFVGSIIVAVGAAVVSFGLGQRRYRNAKVACVWAVAGFLGSAFAPLALLAANPRVVGQACSKCGRLRRVDEAACAQCDTPAPAPARNGTEVFSG